MRAAAPPKAASEGYRLIAPVPLMPGFAARIDLDLGHRLTPEVKAELRRALLQFEVLTFPAQDLRPEAHIDLGSAFGTVLPGAAFFPRKENYPEIEVITFDADHPPELNVWHSDVTWKNPPPTGTVIQITELPETGGNTIWSSGSKAFDALSEGFRAYLRGLTATHSWQGSLVQDALEIAGEDAVINAIRKNKAVVHPVIRRHPESGKDVLFVNEAFTRKINGVSFRESRAILAFLRDWVVQPEFVYSHRWEKNGIAVWDNRSTQHYAAADYWPHRRVTQRVTFQSDADR